MKPVGCEINYTKAKSCLVISKVKNIAGSGIACSALSGIFFATSSLIVQILDRYHPYQILGLR